MRVLGLDLGDRRIGLALSDASGILAGPFKFLRRSYREMEEILEIIRSQGVELIVVGLPLNMDGSQGEEARKAQQFAKILQESSSIPVELWDERLSTFEAERKLREAGKRGKKLKSALDNAAAAIILQDYLDQEKSSPINRG